MVDVPLAAHVSRIVMELASRSDAEQQYEDGNVESDDSTTDDIPDVCQVVAVNFIYALAKVS
jgi:hypothetical protein